MAVGRITQTGGTLLRAAIKKAEDARGVNHIDVGWTALNRYDDDDRTPVAHVAFLNEFGTERIPERPFMRSGVDRALPDVNDAIVAEIDGGTLRVDAGLAERIGGLVADAIRHTIEAVRTPVNAPATRKRKGKSDPLVDTEKMARSVDYTVDR